jgi:hypothetical protein
MQPDELAEYVRRAVDQAPPLTETQRARLAQLLRPVASRDGQAPQREVA